MRPKGSLPGVQTATRHPANTAEEAAALELPGDIAAAGPLPMYLAFARLQNSHSLPVFRLPT